MKLHFWRGKMDFCLPQISGFAPNSYAEKRSQLSVSKAAYNFLKWYVITFINSKLIIA